VVDLGEVVEGAADVVLLAVLARRLVGFLLETTALLLLTAYCALNVGPILTIDDLVDDDSVSTVTGKRERFTNVLLVRAMVTDSLVRIFLERAEL
jgi:hypothetical protein